MDQLYYTAFGQRISSTIPLPELRAASPGPVRWRFSVVDPLPEARELSLLGEEPIYGTVSAKLFRHAAGYRIQVDDTVSSIWPVTTERSSGNPTPTPGGTSAVATSSARSWRPRCNFRERSPSTRVRSNSPMAWSRSSHPNTWKSTLARWLWQAGGLFVTDDALPIDTVPPIMVYPGIQSLRIRADEIAITEAFASATLPAPGRDGKIVLPPLPAEQTLNGPAPLAALYLLRPTSPGVALTAAERTPIPELEATIRLIGQVRIATMLGSTFAPAILTGLATLAREVPVYQLAVVRDLGRLPEVVEQVMAWHGGAPAPNAPATAERRLQPPLPSAPEYLPT